MSSSNALTTPSTWDVSIVEGSGLESLEDLYIILKAVFPQPNVQFSQPFNNTVVLALSFLPYYHGLPEILVSDNATIFKSAEFQAFCKRQGIRQRFIAPGNPSTNGQAERFCQTLKTKLRCMQFEQGTLHEKLCALLFRYRATPLSTGASPAQLMFGRNLRTKLDLLRPGEDDKNEAQQPIFNKHYNIWERVQSRNYAGSILWKFGTVVERLGRLHYLIEIDDGWEGTIDTETSGPTASTMPNIEEKSPIHNNEASSTIHRTSSRQEAEEPSTQQDAEVSNANSQPDVPVPKIRRSLRIRKPIKRMNL
ncbi:uncharacterized protein K02A2.6-like [Macrosteles quadrilineatus]|uniref:uncharacterized protein K02A2.6-like n=1 Tax=Macrosteles quadrilineatus TaxID=74068 RepID=UPI0023E239CF|nr:uncharacterized protein K02A2.6-like [Macrosteles quadrilineatus]